MVLLKRAFPFVLLAACYSPDVRDCVVACSSTDDCAPSQLCGGDGFCVSPEGSCKTAATVDAGRVPPQEQDAAPDARVDLVKLRVRVEGRGEVNVVGVGTCDGGNGNVECFYDVPKNVPVTMQATPKNNWAFEKWAEDCDHQLTNTCALSAMGPMQAKARFILADTVL